MTTFWMLTVTLIIILSVLSYIDIKTLRLPDSITFPLIIAGFLQNIIFQNVWTSSLLGGLFGYGFFVAVEIGFKQITGRQGIGRGDAKLIAASGTWLGFFAIPKVALYASVLGLFFIFSCHIFTRIKINRLPFGPFLSIAFLILWFDDYYGAFVSIP